MGNKPFNLIKGKLSASHARLLLTRACVDGMPSGSKTATIIEADVSTIFENEDWTGLDLRGCDLTGVSFKNAVLDDVLAYDDQWAEMSLTHPRSMKNASRFPRPTGWEAPSSPGLHIVYKMDEGRLGFQLPEPDDVCRKVVERVSECLGRALATHSALPDAVSVLVAQILNKVERALRHTPFRPDLLHDDLDAALVDLKQIDGIDRVLPLRNLMRALQDGTLDLRHKFHSLDEQIRAREAARIGLPDTDVLMAFEALIEGLGDAGEADLVQEHRDHLETLKTARAENPDDDGAPP